MAGTETIQGADGDLTVDDFHTPDIVFQIGIAPCRIDLLTFD